MIVGIDLGTTNSLLAAWKDGEAKLIPNALGDYLTPSVVSLSDDGTVLVGRAARDRLVTAPGRTAAAFKRFMGTDREFRLGKRSFRAEELSALVLKSLKQDAEDFLGETITEAVISVPAYFNDTQRKATRNAGELAGLKVERLINEPTAAALAYGLHRSDEAQFLVFDLGGGTFDVSVLELFDGIMEVRASAGDNFLGGEDFVDALVEHACSELGVHRDKLRPGEMSQLRRAAEQAKRNLNSESSTTLEFQCRGELLSLAIDRKKYENCVQPLLARLRRPVERSMRDASLRTDDLSEVVLVGGSTRKTVVQRLVAQMFGRLPMRHINPDEVVALGAAVQAGLKMRDAALDEVVLTDVCPYTLGVETGTELPDGRVVAGRFSPIIERNSVIPASRSGIYEPLRDTQSVIELEVYQGESRNTADNLLLGKLEVHIPQGINDDKRVEVRFTYDVNGLLEVEATVLKTGRMQRLIIEQTPGAMSKKEVAKRLKALAKLKIHPRDQQENQALMGRAERLYQESLGSQRAQIGYWLDTFSGVLESQNPRDIERARAELSAALDEVETEWM